MKTYRWLVYLFLAFMVTTLTYSLWPSNIISVNKIIGILIILDIVLIEVNKGVKRWDAFGSKSDEEYYDSVRRYIKENHLDSSIFY